MKRAKPEVVMAMREKEEVHTHAEQRPDVKNDGFGPLLADAQVDAIH